MLREIIKRFSDGDKIVERKYWANLITELTGAETVEDLYEYIRKEVKLNEISI